MHADRRNSPGVFDDIRKLLSIIPMRKEAELRTAIALRLEIDEETEQVFGDSARERLQRVANIPRTNTFDAAISAIQKLGILKIDRRYSNGMGGRVYQRGGAYIMTRESWPTPRVAPTVAANRKSTLGGQPSSALSDVSRGERRGRSPSPPLSDKSHPRSAGMTEPPLSVGDYIDNDEVYDEVDGEASPPPFAGANPSSKEELITNVVFRDGAPPIPPQPRVDAATKPSVRNVDTPSIELPANFGSDPNNLNPYAQQVRRNRRYGGLAGLDGSDGVAFDIDSGVLTLVNGTRQTFEREAKARGLDLEAALVKAAAKVAKDPRSASPAYVLAEIRQALSYQEQDKRKAPSNTGIKINRGWGRGGIRGF